MTRPPLYFPAIDVGVDKQWVNWWDEINESVEWQDGIFFSLCALYALVSSVALVSLYFTALFNNSMWLHLSLLPLLLRLCSRLIWTYLVFTNMWFLRSKLMNCRGRVCYNPLSYLTFMDIFCHCLFVCIYLLFVIEFILVCESFVPWPSGAYKLRNWG